MNGKTTPRETKNALAEIHSIFRAGDRVQFSFSKDNWNGTVTDFEIINGKLVLHVDAEYKFKLLAANVSRIKADSE